MLFGLLFYFLCVIAFAFLTKNTPLEISFSKKKYIGLIYFKDILVLIVPGVISYAIGEYRNYKYFYINDQDLMASTFWAIYLIFAFIFFLSVLFRLNKSLKFDFQIFSDEYNSNAKRIIKIFYSNLAIILVILTILTLSGTQHALIASFSGADLIKIRLNNRYSGVPTIILSALQFLNIFGWIIYGVSYHKFNRFASIFVLLILTFASTYLGNKAAIAMNIFSAYVAYATAHGLKINYKNIFSFAFILLGISAAFSVMLYYQFKNDSGFDIFSYTMIRGLMGQVSGFYEQMSLQLSDLNYIWHSVPFANLFVSYPIFNKDLMMMTWGANLVNIEDTGVMNSLFGGEAFAVGGYILLAASPFIAAANYFLACFFVSKLLRTVGRLSKDTSALISTVLIASSFSLTADFAGIFLLKYTIMVLIFLSAPLLLRKFTLKKSHARNSIL